MPWPGLASQLGQPASYELQIMPPSGGDWPVITAWPDTGTGLERERPPDGGGCNQKYHAIQSNTGETGETGEMGESAETQKNNL